MSYRFDCLTPSGREGGISRAVSSIAAGELVVLPTDAVYGLGCDAFSPDAIDRLFRARGSGRTPPPVLIPHARTLDGIATGLAPSARDLVDAFWPGPLTLLCLAQPTLDWDLGDSYGTVSVRMPLHPVALQLLERTGPLAVTAAGPVGMAAPLQCDQARDTLGGTVGVYLDAGTLPGAGGSTIVDVRGERPKVLRVGAIGMETLLEVVPDLDGPRPTGSQEAGS
ncbi:MAG TPA: L-threonylcarbamoyladenylate synthase [Kineosporiaceae bacterium]|nr:L-threonylcarbamoyladenylate synthase [Kineosporiaceae bacterium]